MKTETESYVRITYTTLENELTPAQKAARERFEVALNQAVEHFSEQPGMDGISEIELYPCDDDCEECLATMDADMDLRQAAD